MKVYLFIALLLVLPAPAMARAQEPLLRHYTAKDGLSSNTVYNAYQDSQGFIWFCTNQGVCRFDGHQFKAFTTKDGLPDNEIFDVREDAQGRMWLAGYNSRACYIYNGRIYNADNDRYCEQIENDKLLQRLQKEAGRMDPLELFKGVKHIGVTLYAYAIYDASDVVYLFSKNNIHYFNYHGHILAAGADSLTKLGFDGVLTCFYHQDHIYTITAGKFYKLRIEGTNLVVASKADLPFRVNNYEVINDSTILLASDNGVVPLLFKEPYIDTASSMIAHIPTSSTLKDRSGNLWITTFNDGMYLLPATQPSIFQEGIKVPEASVEAIHVTQGNKIVAGYSNGTVRILDGKKNYFIKLPGFAKRDRIVTLSAANDHVFLCTDRGLYVTDTNSWQASKMTKSFLTKSSIKTVVPHGDNILVGCTHGSGLVDRDGDLLEKFLIARTTALAVDSNTYWIGTLNGPYTYTNSKLQKFDEHEILSDSRITAIAKTCNGDIVFCTHQNGVFIWNKKELVQLSEKNSLSSNLCRKILIDKACNVWVATNSGLDILSRQDDGTHIVRPFPLSDGIPANEIQDFAINGNMLYIACPEGIVVLDINRQTTRMPTRTLITSVIYRDTSISGPAQVVLRYDQNDITINYTAIALGDGSNLLYKYILEGSGGDTVQTKLSSINLNAIGSGNYRFLVWARSNNGDWSEVPASLLLTIRPPFWKTYWFIAVLAIFIASAIYASVRVRIKRIKQTEENKTALNKKMAELEMQALRAQINPHFIFNALNSIQNYYNQNDERNANRYMTTFAKLIRKTLMHSRENWLPLAEEAEMIRDYIHLEQMRFKSIFQYDLYISSAINADELKIPAMLIQPYVENAINHGLRHLQDEKGYLLIDFALVGDCLQCTIDDNGVGFAKASVIEKKTKQYTSLGMEITKNRIETINQLYNADIDVRITDKYEHNNGMHGTVVTIRIPLTHQYYNHEQAENFYRR